MPVSRDRFERGEFPERSVAERVVELLVTHDDKAFTRNEIAARIDADRDATGTALTQLKNRGLVRQKKNYWAITDNTDRVLAASDLHSVADRLDAADGGIDPDEWDEAAPDESHPTETDESQSA